MQQPLNPKQNLSSSQRIKILAVIIFLGILLIVFGILLGLVLRRSGFQLPLPAAQMQATSTSSSVSIAPTLFVPTADCGSPTLVLGTSTFKIQNVAPAPDGSLTVPSDPSGIAYWVEGTTTNSVFVVSPTPQNFTVMSAVSVGTPTTVTWSNCNSSTYRLAAAQAGSLDTSASPDQSLEGITVFFQTDGSGAGFVFKGELTEQHISTINTPDTSGSDVQAEIGLLERTTSPDGTTISLSISIYNYGTSAITVSASDVSLTPAGAAPLALIESEPPLPKEISAAATETFSFTFPRPSTPIATLKIFTVEYDIE